MRLSFLFVSISFAEVLYTTVNSCTILIFNSRHSQVADYSHRWCGESPIAYRWYGESPAQLFSRNSPWQICRESPTLRIVDGESPTPTIVGKGSWYLVATLRFRIRYQLLCYHSIRDPGQGSGMAKNTDPETKIRDRIIFRKKLSNNIWVKNTWV